MASFTCALTSPALIKGNGKLAPRPHCSPARGLPPLPSSLNRWLDPFVLKSTIGYRGLAKDVVVRATGETPAEGETALPEILNTVQETWDKLEDKYAVSALVFALAVALWCSTGLISAVDRLPLLPGIFELVGIGYTGWFIYSNLIFKPDREALITKVKCTYSDIIGKSY